MVAGWEPRNVGFLPFLEPHAAHLPSATRGHGGRDPAQEPRPARPAPQATHTRTRGHGKHTSEARRLDFDAMYRAIDAAHDVDEVKDIRDRVLST